MTCDSNRCETGFAHQRPTIGAGPRSLHLSWYDAIVWTVAFSGAVTAWAFGSGWSPHLVSTKRSQVDKGGAPPTPGLLG